MSGIILPMDECVDDGFVRFFETEGDEEEVEEGEVFLLASSLAFSFPFSRIQGRTFFSVSPKKYSL